MQTSVGASFRNHLADSVLHLGYDSCHADPHFLYIPMVYPADNFKYYSYVLLYVDDCLCICHNAEQELHKINKFFKMKDGLIGNLTFTWEPRSNKWNYQTGVKAWALSSSKYIQEAIKNLQKIFGTQHEWEKAHPKRH